MEKLWFSSTTIFLGFHNLLSKNLVIGVLKGAQTLLKGVLKEFHSFFNAGVVAGVPLKYSSMSGNGSATQKKGVLNPLLLFNAYLFLPSLRN